MDGVYKIFIFDIKTHRPSLIEWQIETINLLDTNASLLVILL